LRILPKIIILRAIQKASFHKLIIDMVLLRCKKMKLIQVILIYHKMRIILRPLLQQKVKLKRVSKEKKLNKQKMLIPQKRLKR
jgi:hypothetical protein